MGGLNDSVVTELVLLPLSCSREKNLFLILLCSLLYVGVILGNVLILFLIITDSHLQSPMYFLLANLSLIDMCLSSTTIPQIVIDLSNEYNVISFQNCMTQICFIHIVGGVEMVLLIAMAFDRCMAICKPLHYLKIMSPKICISFVISGWVTGVIHSMLQFGFVINLPFCGPNKIDSFYCDLPKVIKLACIDAVKYEFIVTANSGFMSMGTFILLLLSYAYIFLTVQKHSSGDLSKAFVTLSAHITVVFLFFIPCIILYAWPSPPPSVDKNLFIVDFAIIPVLNPIIYTLRNKDIRKAIKSFQNTKLNSKFC
ncbi:olfactory receptor 4F15-like [Heterocephalus glaber]|uniref:Olfactory receptor n=1 Tax=Heterocephalus glaber TaxID=10181 RepID=A0AAX6Q4D4_HETGA|nr:olfactory receptor 4F15-like [Heterocephalus glaber]